MKKWLRCTAYLALAGMNAGSALGTSLRVLLLREHTSTIQLIMWPLNVLVAWLCWSFYKELVKDNKRSDEDYE